MKQVRKSHSLVIKFEVLNQYDKGGSSTDILWGRELSDFTVWTIWIKLNEFEKCPIFNES